MATRNGIMLIGGLFTLIRVLFWGVQYASAERRYRALGKRFEQECATGRRPTWVPRYVDPRGGVRFRARDLARTAAYHEVYELCRRIVARHQQRVP